MATFVRVSGLSREALLDGTGNLRISQTVREVLRSNLAGATFVRVDRVVREVLRSGDAPPPTTTIQPAFLLMAAF